MNIIEQFEFFEKRILELGFKSVGQDTYRWYVSPFLHFDIAFRTDFILFTWRTAVYEPQESQHWMTYAQAIVRDDSMRWCDKYFIRWVMVSMFGQMLKEYTAKCWLKEE